MTARLCGSSRRPLLRHIRSCSLYRHQDSGSRPGLQFLVVEATADPHSLISNVAELVRDCCYLGEQVLADDSLVVRKYFLLGWFSGEKGGRWDSGD